MSTDERPPEDQRAPERLPYGASVGVGVGEHRALNWAALAAVLVIGWIVLPVGVGILLGTLLAFTVQPLFERLARRLGQRIAALAMVAASTLALTFTAGGLGWLLVTRGTVLTKNLIAALGPGGPGGGALAALARYTDRLGISQADLTARARELAEAAATRAATVAEALASALAGALLGLFFAMLSMHYILRNWHQVATAAQQTSPIRPDYTGSLIAEFRRVGRTALLGTVVTGIAQGVLATVGYWLAGVPEPVFFGALTGVASLVPAVGTLLVWVPAGVVLILLGQPLHGTVVLVWGAAFVVGLSDYVIRPRLVGKESEVPSLVTFAAIFGGVEVFGLKGLIIGPMLMSIGIAVLRLYASEQRRQRLGPVERAH